MSGIIVHVVEEELWKKFHPTNEMIVTKKGRALFPKVAFRVAGLQPNRFYAFQLHMQRVDNIKYKFDQGTWQEATQGEPRVAEKVLRHSDGFKRGDDWMQNSIQFQKLKITNNVASTDPSHIILQSMHKYMPVLTVVQMGQDAFGQPEQVYQEEFRFEFMQFIAVTAYQNHEITCLKVKHNKYARGFRSENARKRQRAPTPEDEQQSVSPSTSSGSPHELGMNAAKRMAPPMPYAPMGQYYQPTPFFQYPPEFYYAQEQFTAYNNYQYQMAAGYHQQQQQQQQQQMSGFAAGSAEHAASYWNVMPTPIELSPDTSGYTSTTCPSTSP